ncbi:metallophosphoesterase family protein [Azospirillum sp. TSO5]|uniref:metallophosphoesterase family protein n=1 Tax=Azospirillum sp. TSO5 TaxID=716760 RepID=UPI0020003E82|nr:metallophosphoesterase family protein [Azospirillum sp. TSO5]
MADWRDVLFGWRRASPRPVLPPRVPDGLRVYAVGDVHGELRLLNDMLGSITADAQQARESGLEPVVVFLGDYIDRGADSQGVLERLCGGALPRGISWRFLMGNHEAVLLDFLRDPAGAADWLNYGGVETLASYGIRASAGIRERRRCLEVRDRFADVFPEHHRQFLEGLETSVTFGDYLFVHAGIRPGRPLDRQQASDLLWIREPFLSDSRFHGKIIVHGHTMTDEPDLLSNRIGVDTGAYVTGVLSALVLEGDRQCLIQAKA